MVLFARKTTNETSSHQTSFSALRAEDPCPFGAAKYQVCGAGAQREHSVQTYDKCTSYLPIGIIYKY